MRLSFRVGAAVALCVAAPGNAMAGWEPAQPVNVGVGDAGLSSRERPADLVVGQDGLATVLFLQQEGAQAFLTRRASGAAGWTAPQGAPFGAGAAGSPTAVEAAANAAGDTFGVWRFSTNTTAPQGLAWSAVARGPGAAASFAGLPAAAAIDPVAGIDGAGNGYALLQLNTGDLYLGRFDAAAGTWSAPELVGNGQNPQIAVNDAGDVAISYTRSVPGAPQSETRLFVRRRLAGESAFSRGDGEPVDAPGGSVRGYDIAVDRAGAITLVWAEGPSGFVGGRVFARRWLRDDATPGASEILNSPRPVYRPAVNPRVVVDPQGRVTAAWLEQEGNGPLSTRVYSAERTDDRGFGHPERISPANEHITDDESSKPSDELSPGNERTLNSTGAPYDLAVDAEGTATLAYSDSADGLSGLNPAAPADIKVSRRGTGARWSEPVSVAGKDANLNGLVYKPRVAAGKAGQADVLFVQSVDGKRALMATRFEGPPPPSGEHQATVTSWAEPELPPDDRTKILVHWCPAAGLEPGERAPTIIAGSGWGIPGRRCAPGNSPEEEIEGVFGSTSVKAFTDAGYNVLTFDARGFWRSGGEAQVDDPLYEGKDMQALIDYVAHQPEALLDRPGDPRLGMAGGSYGGGIQFVAAALDDRVDAIAPAIAWNSLVTSLFPRETVKAGWAAILVGAGVPMTTLPGVLSPAGIQQGHMAPQVYDATQTAVQSGTIKPETRAWFEDKGPHSLLHRIDAPTLLIQGTVDTLFTLDEGHRNFEALRVAGTEVKMLWFCGGHGGCERHGEDQEHIDLRVLNWFDHHLRGRDVSTGPTFEWVDEDGGWHESASYPPRFDSALRATGSGRLSLTPGEQPGSGGVIFATPYSFRTDHPAAVDVPIETPAEETTVLGAPQLRATYTATGVTTYGTGVEGAAADRTYVYAQIVDNTRNRVVGNQATPIPITLDGEEHEVSLPLERIASRSPKGGYSLQIVPQTSVYDGQRAAGTINFSSIDISLPVDLPGELPLVGGSGTSGPLRRPGDRVRTLRCHGLKATITGTRRADVIRGTSRRDVIVARRGNDTIRARGGRDVVCAGAGKDRLLGGAGGDRLYGGVGRDVLRGGRGADRLFGGAGADRLVGGAGADRLLGGAGRDVLRGDRRTDVLRGGLGKDEIFRLP